jgi:hypothetical protein
MRSNIILAAAVAAAGWTGAANAAAVSTFNGDDVFNALCTDGTNAEACRVAQGEFRGGNAALNGDWEVGVVAAGTTNDDAAWTSDRINPFSFSYDADTGDLVLSVDFGGAANAMATQALGAGGLDAVNSLFIRTRGEGDDTFSFTDLILKDAADAEHSIGGVAPASSGWQGAGYLQVSGFDFTQDWTLTGNAIFDWDGNAIPRGSRLGGTLKLTTIDPAPIPLPAPALFLVGGMAMLGGLRKLRSA